ncbi:MAG: polyphosphate kinase 1, partial [Chloroflexota bacterium]
MADKKNKAIDLSKPNYFINRELSNIEFNRRVLLEGFDTRHPILERVKFCAIFSNNMDEFFMVRVSGIKQQVILNVTNPPPDGLSPREQLVQIHRLSSAMFQEQASLWRKQLLPGLAKNNIHILTFDEIKRNNKDKLADYFEREIFPVLTPLAFDPGHPFPHISNLSLNLAVVVRDPKSNETHFARVKVPDTLPRLVPVNPLSPDDLLTPTDQKFVWLEEVIIANLSRLFPGMIIDAAYPFRVTRNTDMDIQEEGADDLLKSMEETLRRRPFGFVVRLEVASSVPDHIRDILVSNLEVGPMDVYTIDGPLGLNSLFNLTRIDRPDLKDTKLLPSIPPPLRTAENIFSILKRQDVLLHHPYDSFNPVVEFLEKAAEDPRVLAIKQTLYRVGPNPPVVHALMRARENGKQVTVLVELKARFDEESNIEWARALENAGVHVVYGLIGLKTHAKISLVVRREREGLRRYIHLATGNYNSVTARIYTDLGLMTSDPALGADISEVFNVITGYSNQSEYRKCLVAPSTLRPNVASLIAKETTFGSEGKIIMKINHLVDAELVKLLYKASIAGVKIQLMIRGICSLRPGMAGISENITVISHVGRFLEHTRIYYFHNQGDPTILMGSADLMPRNLDRRVETVFPVESPMLKREITENILAIYAKDTVNAHILQPDGSYIARQKEVGSSKKSFNAQEWYLRDRTTYV